MESAKPLNRFLIILGSSVAIIGWQAWLLMGRFSYFYYLYALWSGLLLALAYLLLSARKGTAIPMRVFAGTALLILLLARFRYPFGKLDVRSLFLALPPLCAILVGSYRAWHTRKDLDLRSAFKSGMQNVSGVLLIEIAVLFGPSLRFHTRWLCVSVGDDVDRVTARLGTPDTTGASSQGLYYAWRRGFMVYGIVCDSGEESWKPTQVAEKQLSSILLEVP